MNYTHDYDLRIAVALRQRGVVRFNELQRAVNAANSPMLSKHLKRMIRSGLVERRVVRIEPASAYRIRVDADRSRLRRASISDGRVGRP